MRYGQLRKFDIANGPGVRSSIFVTGCSHKCPGCFNEEYQDFNAGEEWTQETTEEIISYLKDENVVGLSLLGGEPFENAEELAQIIRDIKKEVDKNIWAYSGFKFEQIIKDPIKLDLLDLCDVLVDGLFVESLKDVTLKFRGSSNQRILDVKKSRENNQPIEYIW